MYVYVHQALGLINPSACANIAESAIFEVYFYRKRNSWKIRSLALEWIRTGSDDPLTDHCLQIRYFPFPSPLDPFFLFVFPLISFLSPLFLYPLYFTCSPLPFFFHLPFTRPPFFARSATSLCYKHIPNNTLV